MADVSHFTTRPLSSSLKPTLSMAWSEKPRGLLNLSDSQVVDDNKNRPCGTKLFKTGENYECSDPIEWEWDGRRLRKLCKILYLFYANWKIFWTLSKYSPDGWRSKISVYWAWATVVPICGNPRCHNFSILCYRLRKVRVRFRISERMEWTSLFLVGIWGFRVHTVWAEKSLMSQISRIYVNTHKRVNFIPNSKGPGSVPISWQNSGLDCIVRNPCIEISSKNMEIVVRPHV